ncbi:phasin family protein [Ciceribacter sp. L1K23]|uniref:phasin family protein n=1 Tax=unclassified Ciceribacter TaxID=2628820 RepID=UPI001ABDD9DC|nr:MULTISPECIES: phasin family protein [unclassified Ciceribacter]MBO3760151.1 phasin family protein [Ciceribacter sp. L1K22]MBR0555730.1 phasin family protein [Ciceribacter sp. L1K23]
MFNFDEANRKGKEAMDNALKGYSDVARGFQAIATEATEYSKKSFQDMAAHMEALTSVKSVEQAMELQTSYLKSSYESFVAEATKMGEMYADLAKTAYKPYEAPVSKAMSMSNAA